MKFVGSIKGRHYLIDPETYESELREKIAQSIEAIELEAGMDNAVGVRAIAASIARGLHTSQSSIK